MTLTEARMKFFKEHTHVDRIIETEEWRDYLQLLTSQGGDIEVYRVYGDGVSKEFMLTMR